MTWLLYTVDTPIYKKPSMVNLKGKWLSRNMEALQIDIKDG